MRKLAAVLGLLVIIGSAGIAVAAFASGSSPSFSFSSDEQGATFTCAVDGGQASACTSPQAYQNLSPGQHTVTITSTFTVPQPAPPLKAAFTITPNPATAGQPATFDGSSSTCDVAPCSYAWTDPVDGQNYSTAASFSYTFNSTTTHQMKLTVTDANGTSDSSTQSFDVQAAAPPPPPPPSGQTNCAPAKADTMTNTVSHTCGFADTTNTGIPAGTTLYPASAGPGANTGSGWTWSSGAISTTADNAVITNVTCGPCHINVRNAGVTIKDSDLQWSGANSYVIQLLHANSLTVDHNNIHGTGVAAPGGCDDAVRDMYADSDFLTITNNNIWYCGTPMNNIADGGLIKNNYVHDFGNTGTGPHYEALQLEQGNGTLMTVQDNTFLNPNSQTAAIILSDDAPSGVENNRTITHNLLAGGGYTFYGAGKSSTPSTNIRVTNNSFSRLYFPQAGYYGPVAYWTTSTNTWSGNIWDDSGQTLTP